jgi:hypothetical protein
LLHLADTRQGIAYEHIHDSAATIKSRHQDRASGLFAYFADDARFAATGRLLQCFQRCVG